MFLLWHHTYIRVANIPKSASEHVTVKSLPRSHFLPPPSLFTFTMLKVYLSSAICDIFSLKSVSNAKQKQNKIKRNKKKALSPERVSNEWAILELILSYERLIRKSGTTMFKNTFVSVLQC